MIGQTIESRSAAPLGAIGCLLLAALLDVGAIALRNSHVALFSLFPWLCAGLLWRARPRPFVAHFTDTALEVDDPPLLLAYADLQGLLAARRPTNPFKAGPRCYAIEVIHADGVLGIPARLKICSDEVFSFLFGRFSPGGSRDVPVLLTDYLRHKERAFGAERVWTYATRTHLGRNKRYPRRTAFFLAWAVVAPVWLLWSAVHRQEGWLLAGIVSLLGGPFAMLSWRTGRRAFRIDRKWRQAGLVVAPDGLALAQGDLVGQLRWDEVRDVTLDKRAGTPQLSGYGRFVAGIVLKVEGTIIIIADIYDRPLALIYQNICHYWRGQPLGDAGDHATIPPLSVEKVRPAVPGVALPSEGITPPEL